jgi:hypothetical protein
LLVPKKKEQPPSTKSYFIVKLLAGVGDPQPMCSPKRTANQVHCEKSTQIEMKTIGRGADVPETLRLQKQNTLLQTLVRIFCSFVNDACARFLIRTHTPGNFHRMRINLGRRDVCTKKGKSQLHQNSQRRTGRKSLSAALEYVRVTGVYINISF